MTACAQSGICDADEIRDVGSGEYIVLGIRTVEIAARVVGRVGKDEVDGIKEGMTFIFFVHSAKVFVMTC